MMCGDNVCEECYEKQIDGKQVRCPFDAKHVGVAKEASDRVFDEDVMEKIKKNGGPVVAQKAAVT